MPRPVTRLTPHDPDPPSLAARLRDLRQAVAAAARDDVPAILGGLAELQALAQARLFAAPSTTPPHNDPLLTVPEVARRLALPVTRVYELCRQGRLPTVKIGKYIRVRPEDLARWVGHRAEGT